MAVTKAEAVWQGTLREGKGTMKLPKGNYEGRSPLRLVLRRATAPTPRN
ncbi:MAG: hypothetical protein R2856_18285 [Caldilineaceae bacterium]